MPPSHQADLAAWFEHVLVPESTPALRRYVRRLLPGDPHHADDIVQETLLRAWLHRTTVAAARSPQAWLSRVARNLSVDAARRAAARPAEVDEDVTTRAWPHGDDPFDATLDRTVLTGALRTLSPLQREALVLVHCADRTHVDVADALGVPPGTVKSRAHYGARELVRALGERGVTAY